MEHSRRRRWGRGARLYVFVLLLAAMLGMPAAEVKADDGDKATIDFHGYLESNLILRDENGSQNGFLDNLAAVQQRNTLKFDVDVDPKLQFGENYFLQNIHLTYRGAYDSIFDLRPGAYGDIEEHPGVNGGSRFDTGLRDIKYENDLREATITLSYNGPLGSAMFRPGRQLVSWGKTNQLDQICPADASFQMFFLNPDDLKQPLWMGRLNYNLPPLMIKNFGLNIDLLWIPDIRPSKMAPMDKSMQAPYTSFMKITPGPTYQNEVPTDKKEYGIKLALDFGQNLQTSFVYFRDVSNNPFNRLDLAYPGILVKMSYPTRNIWGFFFDYYIEAFDVMITGEWARREDEPVGARMRPDPKGPPWVYLASTQNDMDYFNLTLTHNFWWRWLTSDGQTYFQVMWDHSEMRSFDGALNRSPRTTDAFGMVASWTWLKRMSPMIYFSVNPPFNRDGGTTYMGRVGAEYKLTPNWYTRADFQGFFGDKNAAQGKYPKMMIESTELTFKIGYNW